MTSSLVDLIEAQVRARSDAVAVVAGGGSLTYEELDARANQLAHHLQALDVGPETVVGVCVERSLEMALAFLGVLKAGGACMPLDPSYPMERLALMLADSKTPVVLTCERLLERLPPHAATTVRLDADWDEMAGGPNRAPDRTVAPENLAYVIYTSGSTGEPKGVMLTHRGLVNHNNAAAELFGLSPSDRVLQFCS
ncbi:MAG TPA: AMP-binding protein, partial [Acidimicrobiales bacterium]|nr:AMP-binding protein [Acidimicrobiales bacterium]